MCQIFSEILFYFSLHSLSSFLSNHISPEKMVGSRLFGLSDVIVNPKFMGKLLLRSSGKLALPDISSLSKFHCCFSSKFHAIAAWASQSSGRVRAKVEFSLSLQKVALSNDIIFITPIKSMFRPLCRTYFRNFSRKIMPRNLGDISCAKLFLGLLISLCVVVILVFVVLFLHTDEECYLYNAMYGYYGLTFTLIVECFNRIRRNSDLDRRRRENMSTSS